MIELRERTEDTVKEYFAKTNTENIKKFLPQKATTVEEALKDYRQTLLADAKSYGKTIWLDNSYIGDVWAYCIDLEDNPNAMLSYCIIEPKLWSKGIATTAISMFLDELLDKFHVDSVGAFLYADNLASIRVLEKNNFVIEEEFEEDGRKSLYFFRLLT